MNERSEQICSRCPGSLWGAKSICRVHGQPIGLINRCQQWENENHGVRAVEVDSTLAMNTVQKVVDELNSYPWMVREIKRISQSLKGYDSAGVAMYGIEASMPRPEGSNSDPTAREAMKRVKMANQLKEFQGLIARIDQAADKITDNIDRSILDCMLEGWRQKEISRHIGVSRQKFYEMKRSITVQMAKYMYPDQLIAS